MMRSFLSLLGHVQNRFHPQKLPYYRTVKTAASSLIHTRLLPWLSLRRENLLPRCPSAEFPSLLISPIWFRLVHPSQALTRGIQLPRTVWNNPLENQCWRIDAISALGKRTVGKFKKQKETQTAEGAGRGGEFRGQIF